MRDEAGGAPWSPSAIRTRGLAYEQVAGQIRTAIVAHALRVGERLPAESELARQLNVSRGTVREALRLLASQHFITTSRGVQGGSVVCLPSAIHIEGYLGTSYGLLAGSDTNMVDWMIEARELLEVPAAGLAAARRSDADLLAIEADLAHPRDDHHEVLRANQDFHVLLARATGNAMLELMLRPLLSVLNARLDDAPPPPEIYEQIDAEHRQIADAVADRDEHAARRAMEAHLSQLRSVYAVVIVPPERTSS